MVLHTRQSLPTSSSKMLVPLNIGMLLHQLFEATVDDIAAQRAASHAYHAFATYVAQAKKPDFQGRMEDYGLIFGFDGAAIGLAQYGLNIAIFIGVKLRSQIGMTGAAIGGTTKAVYQNYTDMLVLNAAKSMTMDDVKSVVATVEFMHLFKHEFIHALDTLRSGGKIDYKFEPGDKSGYMNSNAEYNARYHDLAGSLLGMLHDVQDQPEGTAAEYADLYRITGDFWKDLSHLTAQDRGTKSFMKWLTDDKRRALLKRLYKLHHEIVLLMQQPAAKPTLKKAA